MLNIGVIKLHGHILNVQPNIDASFKRKEDNFHKWATNYSYKVMNFKALVIDVHLALLHVYCVYF